MNCQKNGSQSAVFLISGVLPIVLGGGSKWLVLYLDPLKTPLKSNGVLSFSIVEIGPKYWDHFLLLLTKKILISDGSNAGFLNNNVQVQAEHKELRESFLPT